MLGRHLGWRALYLIHSKATIRRYEKILGVKVRQEFDAEGPDAHRSVGLRSAQTHSNFWKVVSGALAIDNATRALID